MTSDHSVLLVAVTSNNEEQAKMFKFEQRDATGQG